MNGSVSHEIFCPKHTVQRRRRNLISLTRKVSHWSAEDAKGEEEKEGNSKPPPHKKNQATSLCVWGNSTEERVALMGLQIGKKSGLREGDNKRHYKGYHMMTGTARGKVKGYQKGPEKVSGQSGQIPT